MNGWYRLWIVACIVVALLIASSSYWALAWTDPNFQGDFVRTMIFIWLLCCGAMLGIGHLVAWARRGFKTTLPLLLILSAVTAARCDHEPAPEPVAVQQTPAPAPNVLALIATRGGHSSSAYMKIEGQVQNISGSPLKSIAAVATWYDKADQFIAADTALIEYDPLLPGQTSPFHVLTRANPKMENYTVEFKSLLGGTIQTEDRRKKR